MAGPHQNSKCGCSCFGNSCFIFLLRPSLAIRGASPSAVADEHKSINHRPSLAIRGASPSAVADERLPVGSTDGVRPVGHRLGWLAEKSTIELR